MTFKVIVTLGPSIIHGEILSAISKLGSCIFRINGAHVDSFQAQQIIERTRAILPEAQLMIDLPGNKIRTTRLYNPIRLIKGKDFTLFNEEINYPEFHKHINVGDILYANDSSTKLEVLNASDVKINLLSHSDAMLDNNKGLHVPGIYKVLPFLFEKDKGLIQVAMNQKIDWLSLSFVRSADDVKAVKDMISTSPQLNVIAKIETKLALDNLESILGEVQFINIDRGDLASDIGIHNLVRSQRHVVCCAKNANKTIFLATQFLKNMETKPVPLVSEVVGLHDAFMNDINGIQLSEETAVGRYPYECVKFVFDAFEKHVDFEGKGEKCSTKI